MGWLKKFFAPAKTITSTGSTSALEVITYLASLASSPQDIEPILEDLRELTAKAEPGKPLTQSAQMILARMYTELETHLVEKERLRQFSRESVRARITERFPRHNLNEDIFWRNINNT